MARHHLLTVMPTGSGRSPCFQVPAPIGDNLTVLVSPLVAQIQDQVAAEGLHLGNERAEHVAAWSEVRLLYMAPERLMRDRARAAHPQACRERLRRSARASVDERGAPRRLPLGAGRAPWRERRCASITGTRSPRSSSARNAARAAGSRRPASTLPRVVNLDGCHGRERRVRDAKSATHTAGTRPSDGSVARCLSRSADDDRRDIRRACVVGRRGTVARRQR